MNPSAESELIEQAKAGSRPAFGQLMTSHQHRLYRFLLARARSRADAEDALQEAFLNAMRYLHTYNPRWKFSTWLYRIALRELGKVSQRDGINFGSEQTTACYEDPLAKCMARDDKENLWLLARSILNEESFTTLWLRYAEDMTIRETARVMRRPETWVKVVAHRARKKLAANHHRKRVSQGIDGPSGKGRVDTSLKCETT